MIGARSFMLVFGLFLFYFNEPRSLIDLNPGTHELARGRLTFRTSAPARRAAPGVVLRSAWRVHKRART